jgi:hypothetical protein
MNRFSTVLASLVVCISFFGVGRSGYSEVPVPRLPPTEFDKLIERIRSAEASRAWQQLGWKDDVIDSTLRKTIAAGKTAGSDALQLPIEFGDLRPARAKNAVNFATKNLLVATGAVDIAHANKSIFLIDGSIRISHAHDCVVIARGFVDVGHCERCVVIAGHHVNVGFDGLFGGDMPKLPSLLVSGRSMRIAHAHETICSAPEFIHVSHANNVTFLATSHRDISHQEACHFKDKVNPPLSMPAPMDVPPALFSVKQVCDAEDNPSRQLVTVQKNGIEYVLRLGSKIVDEKGAPIPSWSDWSVAFISEGVVLFSDGKSDMSAREKSPAQ